MVQQSVVHADECTLQVFSRQAPGLMSLMLRRGEKDEPK